MTMFDAIPAGEAGIGGISGDGCGLELGVQRSTIRRFGWLFEDIERKPVLQFHAGRGEDGPHGAGRSPLLADDLADVRWRDTEAKYGSVAVSLRLYGHFFGTID
jgi:hypothetical protein